MNIYSVTLPPDPATAVRPFVPSKPDVPAALDDKLIDASLDAGRDRRGNRATRADGWTPERIRIFLVTLSECGCVTTAAKEAGLSVRSAYNLRNRAEGRAFHLGWEAALQLAKRPLADALMARAMNGCVDQIRKDGEVVAERCRFDNRLSMATLTRLDQRAVSSGAEAEAVRIVTEDFDSFVDLASDGGAGADEFLAARRSAHAPTRHPGEPDDAGWGGTEILGPLIPISDLDPAKRDSWTEDQIDRARRAGILDRRDFIDPQPWDTVGWPAYIPESLGPLIARNVCHPVAGTRGRKWISLDPLPALAVAPPAESNGNDELREL